MNEKYSDSILCSIPIGSTIEKSAVPASGKYAYWGLRDWEQTNEKILHEEGGLVTVKRENWTQVLTMERLLGVISYGVPWCNFTIRRIGERDFEFVDFTRDAPPKRSPLERLTTRNWFGS